MASDAVDVTVRNLAVVVDHAPAVASGPGISTYGLKVSNVANMVVTRVVVDVGDGGPGADGSPPSQTPEDGEDGACLGWPPWWIPKRVMKCLLV